MPDSTQHRIRECLLALVPEDGSPIGNTALRRDLEANLKLEGFTLTEDDYWAAHLKLISEGILLKGQGRGGSVRRNVAQSGGDFDLEQQEHTPDSPKPKSAVKAKPTVKANPNDTTQVISYRHLDKRVNNPEVGMVTPATDPDEGKAVWAYDPHIDPALQFDPSRARIEALIDDALASGDLEHMQEALEELKRLQSPYLNWAGKAVRTSFEIDTVSLHVHERIDPASILAAVRKGLNQKGDKPASAGKLQFDLFNAPFENLPLRDAIDFYRHERGWANRLIAGDSLLVMNSLLQKESMAGRVQMIYIDPPYGIKYGSNFQPFVGKRDVKDRNDADLTQEPEMLKAFRDTWELGIHSYLTYLRDRLLLARELLHESGSVFVQISDENLHHVREIMDEVFGSQNFCSVIAFSKTSGSTSSIISSTCDFILWYSRCKKQVKYRPIKTRKPAISNPSERYVCVEMPNGLIIDLSVKQKSGELPLPEGRILRLRPTDSQDENEDSLKPVLLYGREYFPPKNRHWSVSSRWTQQATKSGYIYPVGNSLTWKSYRSDENYTDITNDWLDIKISGFGSSKIYVVETKDVVIERCLLMTTDPGDLVLDPTCGSGTTAFVAEKWGRRWITCDTSRVAVTLAKQRLMTASYDYYELRHPHEGLKGGFIYKTVPHVTLKSIANNPDIDTIYEQMHPAIGAALGALNDTLASTPGFKPLQEWEVPFDWPEDWSAIARNHFEAFHTARQAMQKQMDASIAAHADQETLYDQPGISKNKLRISGPFTVEAVPFPTVKSLDEASGPEEADASIARTGESGRQHQWRNELLKTGIRGKGGQMLKFADLEALPTDADIRNLHATGHLESGERVVISFGPEYAALEQRQVSNALNEAGNLFPLPKMIVFCAFAFDPEAAKDIDAIKGITALKAQMNTDLLTEDLKKNRASNESYWLMGQPELEVRSLPDGQYQVEVHGFDYFDTVKGELVSGGKSKIALWALDPDYDERSLFPRQVFFPMAGKGEGWEKLKKNIRAELDESRLEQFQGTVSLPFAAGDNRKIAVKIIDDRGIESLKVMPLP
jgi:adenine-specific DNA-methyltransferase